MTKKKKPSKNPLQSLQKLLKDKSWIGPGEGHDLWILISALRGPDGLTGPSRNEDSSRPLWDLKEDTTLRLRTAIAKGFFFPMLEDNFSNKLPHEGTAEDYEHLKKKFPRAPEHFLRHYVNACFVYWKLKEKIASEAIKGK